jgi:hypothetical protein
MGLALILWMVEIEMVVQVEVVAGAAEEAAVPPVMVVEEDEDEEEGQDDQEIHDDELDDDSLADAVMYLDYLAVEVEEEDAEEELLDLFVLNFEDK